MAKKTQDAKALAQMFRVLGDETRLRLLMILKEEERNVTSLCEELRAPQPTVSRHLGILRDAGLVRPRRDGKQVYYAIENLRRRRSLRGLQGLLDGDTSLQLGPLVLGLTASA